MQFFMRRQKNENESVPINFGLVINGVKFGGFLFSALSGNFSPLKRELEIGQRRTDRNGPANDFN